MNKLLLPALLSLALCSPLAQAAEGFEGGDGIRSILNKKVGQKIELRLKSGEKIGGKVETVGEQLIHLTSVSGMELFEAVIVVEDVSAILYRSAAK